MKTLQHEHQATDMEKLNTTPTMMKKCTSRDCLSGTYEISGCLILVEQCLQSKCFASKSLSYSLTLPSIGFDHD